MKTLYKRFDYVDAALNRWLIRHSIVILRVSLGLIFFGFGVLKYFPQVSPAQDIAAQTTHLLDLGLVPAGVARVLLASLECAIGLCFITGKWLRIAVWMLGLELIGILSPVVLLPKELFTGPFHAPNLVGQYVLKDIVLAGAGMVIAATLRGGHLVTGSEPAETVASTNSTSTPFMLPDRAEHSTGSRENPTVPTWQAQETA